MEQVPVLELGQQEPEQGSKREKELVIEESAGNGLSLEQEVAGTETAHAYTYSAQEVLRHKDFARLTPEELVDNILDLLSDEVKREGFASSAGKLSVPDAGRRLAEEVIKLVVERRDGKT